MKVIHVIPSLALSEGGPSMAIPLMERALFAVGVDVTVATTDDQGRGARGGVPLESLVSGGSSSRYYFRKQTGFYKISFPLGRWLRANVSAYDLVHVHALFSYASVAGMSAAKRQGVPYIVRPLGVLNRYGMSQRRPGLKALSLRWIEGPLLRKAAGMHYTSAAEREEAEEAGVTAPAFVVPLGLDVGPCIEAGVESEFYSRYPGAAGREIVLFLSRLDPKKGVDLLLEAFGELLRSRPRALLAIAGQGTPEYEESMRRHAVALGVADQVLWLGQVTGDAKRSLFAASQVFVLPSHSENFGIAVVEALAAGLPVVLSEGVAVSKEVVAAGAGLVVPRTAGAFATAMTKLLGEPVIRVEAARRARALAEEQFSLAAMGRGLVRMYQDVMRASSGDTR